VLFIFINNILFLILLKTLLNNINKIFIKNLIIKTKFKNNNKVNLYIKLFFNLFIIFTYKVNINLKINFIKF
jgi:hypothetical protein